ncbi:MAG: GGDEF domain-containing protein [Granulosicoccus sp.]
MPANLKLKDTIATTADQTLWNAIGLPLAQAAMESSLGLALVDGSGNIKYGTPSFSLLLSLGGDLPGRSLIEHLETRFRLDEVTTRRALTSDAATILELTHHRAQPPVVLHIAELNRDERVVIAENVSGDTARLLSATDGADIDSLTRLGNRSLLNTVLEDWKSTASGDREPVLILMDLDHFDVVNKKLGRPVADELLVLVADRLKRAIRNEDSLLRLEADAFVVLHPGKHGSPAPEAMAERLISLLSRPFRVRAHQINIGASIGIAKLNHGTETVNDLLPHAKLALRDAKAAGRDTYCTYYD